MKTIIGKIIILIAIPFAAIILAVGITLCGAAETLFGERIYESYPWERKFWL